MRTAAVVGRLMAAVCGVVGAGGCSLFSDDAHEVGYPFPCSEESPELAPPTEAVADTLTLNGRQYTLHADAWRNLMPGPTPANPRLLNVFVRMTEVDSVDVPDDVALEHVWVAGPDGWWSAAFTDEVQPYVPPFQLERMARCGPEWAPGSSVDVVVSVSDNGIQSFLRIAGVTVEAAE